MYRGRAERDRLLVPYLSEGRLAGNTCFVAVAEDDPVQLRALGHVDLPGELIVRTTDEAVFGKDSFDIEEIIGFWDATVTAALEPEGVSFVRLSAEATWWLTQVPSLDDLLRYEHRLNHFAASHPQSILCLYDIEELGSGVVFEAMKVHPRIWLSGLILENPFFQPPEPSGNPRAN
jgi:hypothetical protein